MNSSEYDTATTPGCPEFYSLLCGLTISDTRTTENDTSGQLIQDLLHRAQHKTNYYQLIRDEPKQIISEITVITNNTDVDVMILNGGTGIAPRDTTYDAIENLLEKTLAGFGEIFRYLSYREIASRAIDRISCCGWSLWK